MGKYIKLPDGLHMIKPYACYCNIQHSTFSQDNRLCAGGTTVHIITLAMSNLNSAVSQSSSDSHVNLLSGFKCVVVQTLGMVPIYIKVYTLPLTLVEIESEDLDCQEDAKY